MHTRKTFLMISAALHALSCKPMMSASALKNIYSADESDQTRRHEATANEVTWTVRATGCSGTLLTPTLVLTANHCKLRSGARLKSGWSVHTDGPVDLVVQEVLEANPILDYAIASVKFTHPMPSNQTFPPYIATKPSDLYSSEFADQGERIFTVGFPDDKSREWRATYAEGQLKYQEDYKIFFNVGVINGNSGGGILKKENFMLAGIAVGGSKAYREAGWDNNSIDDAKNWNYGTSTWAIYKVSRILQEQFPEGRNKYFGNVLLPKTKLYISLKASAKGASLKVSSSLETETLILCPKDSYPCSLETPGSRKLKLDVTASGRRFYAADSDLTSSDLASLGLTAFDKKGEIIGQRKVSLEQRGKEP